MEHLSGLGEGGGQAIEFVSSYQAFCNVRNNVPPTPPNKDHRHTGIGLLTPEVMHHGLAQQVYTARSETLQTAYELHPERFVKRIPVPPLVPEAAWINKPKLAPSSEEKVH